MAGLDPNFERIMSKVLAPQARAGGLSLVNKGQRPAVTLGSEGTVAPDPTNIQEVTRFFDTDEASRQYQEIFTSGGTVAAKLAAQAQSDIISLMERDFKSATLTPVRARCFEASRRSKHSTRGGPILSNVLHMVEHYATLDEEGLS